MRAFIASSFLSLVLIAGSVAFVSSSLTLPSFAQASILGNVLPNLIVCDPGKEAVSSVGANGTAVANASANHDCTWNDLITLANNFILFIIYLSVPLAIVGFGWAGFLYLTAAANEGQVKKAQGIFWAIIKGLVFVLIAYLIVYTILNTVLNKNAYSLLKLQ